MGLMRRRINPSVFPFLRSMTAAVRGRTRSWRKGTESMKREKTHKHTSKKVHHREICWRILKSKKVMNDKWNDFV